jgi:hypothetical protein
MTRYICAVLVVFVVGCAKASPTLTPTGARAWQANEAVLAINQLQSAAIGLNRIQVCPPAPCHPLLSDANTRLVGNTATSARNTIDAVPAGWKATAQAALTQIAAQLDAAGRTQLAAYLTAANSVVSALKP